MDFRAARGTLGIMEERVTLDEIGVTTRVIIRGEGPPILFLHGNPDDAQQWTRLAARLEGRFRCIAPDLPGYGESTAPPASYDFSVQAQVAFVSALVKRLRLDRFALAVHDVGGVMGIPWAAANPARLHRFFVFNTVAFADFDWFPIARAWGKPGWQARLRMALMTRWLFKLVFRRDHPRLPPEELERFADAFPRNRVAKESSLRQFPQMTRRDFFDGYAALIERATAAVPTTVLWGLGDPYVPDRYAGSFASAEIVRFPGAGHWPMLVEPDRVADEISRRMS
jgi:pimeloyl-ACP methyl ester carboxylesterase